MKLNRRRSIQCCLDIKRQNTTKQMSYNYLSPNCYGTNNASNNVVGENGYTQYERNKVGERLEAHTDSDASCKLKIDPTLSTAMQNLTDKVAEILSNNPKHMFLHMYRGSKRGKKGVLMTIILSWAATLMDFCTSERKGTRLS